MGLLTNFISRVIGKATHAVGKAINFGHAVGKGLYKFAENLTPQASETPNLSGLSKVCAIASNEAYNTNRLKDINGFLLDDELSNKNTAIYHNYNTVIIAFRGTAELADLKTDISILKGTIDNQQFKEAVLIYNKVKNKYTNNNIIATGHSKGGSLALYLNSLYGIKAEVFNAGVGLGFINNNPNKNNATLHIIKGDPISSLAGIGNLGNIRVYNSVYGNNNPLEAHSIKNFIN